MLTEREIKTFFSMNNMDGIAHSGCVRWEDQPQADYRYGCYGVYDGNKFRLQMSRILRLLDDEIFSGGDIGLTFSWSSRSGYAMFNLTSKAEDVIRQMVHEYNAGQMLNSAE